MTIFKHTYPEYFFTQDKTRIFTLTNFPRDQFNPKKTLLVFNYGLVCNITHWKYQLQHFDELGYQILFHDYRGHFNSSGQDDIENVTFKNITSDLHQIILSFAPKKVIHFGHSMGVNVTLEYALTYPKYLVAQILISGTVIPPQDIMFDSNLSDITLPSIDFISKKYPKIYNTLWKTSFMNPVIRKIVHNGGFNTERVSDEFIQKYLKKIGELSPELFMKLLDEMKNHDVINRLHQIKTPTLIIGGDKDSVIPNYTQDILHKNLPQNQLYIMKDAGHVPQVDFPEFVNQRIESFINQEI